jgi:hypothetical protein
LKQTPEDAIRRIAQTWELVGNSFAILIRHQELLLRYARTKDVSAFGQEDFFMAWQRKD